MTTQAAPFPDMHHKMSKKVAQLTKVIYHLHTRNDDCEYEKQYLKQHYEKEIQQIQKNCTDKIQAYKKRIDAAGDDRRTEEALKKLKSQHEAEKKEVLAKFEEYKSTVRGEVDASKAEADRKVQAMQRELQESKSTFEQRLKEFSELTARMEGCGQEVINELKKKHKEELEEHVRQHNARYNEMLKQRLEAEEELERECQDKMTEMDKAARSREQELRAELNLDKKKALDDLEAEIRKQKAAGIERENDLKQQLSKCEGELSEANKTIQTLKDKLDALEREMASTTQGLQNDAKGLTQKISSLQAKLQAKEASETALKDDMAKSEAALAAEKRQHNKVQKDLDELREKMNSLSAGSESALRNLEATVQNQRNELDKQAKESASALEKLKKLQAELSGKDAEAKKWKQEFDKAVVAKQEYEKVATSELKQVKSDYEKQLAELKEELLGKAKAAADNAKSSEATKLQKMADEHKAAIDKLQQQLSQLKSKMEADAEAAKQKCEKMVSDTAAAERMKAESELKKACDGFNKQISDMMTKLKQANQALERETAESNERKKQLLEHTKRIEQLQECIRGKETDLKQLEERIKALEAQLKKACAGSDNAAQEAQEWRNKAQEAQKEIVALKKQLEAQAKQAASELQSKLKGMTDHWMSRLESEKEEVSNKLSADAREALKRKEREAEEQQRRLKEAAERDLKSKEEEKAKEAAVALAKIQEEQNRAAALKLQKEQEEARLRAQHQNEMSDAESKLQMLLEEMRQKAKQDLAQATAQCEAKLRAEHKNAVADKDRQHQSEMKQLQDKHTQELATLEKQGKEAVVSARKEEIDKAEKQLSAAQRSLKDEYETRIKAQNEAHSEIVEKMTNQATELQEQVHSYERHISQLQSQQDDLRDELTACQKQLEAEIERARLTAADTEALHQQHISKLKAEHKAECGALEHRFESNVEKLKQAHLDEQEQQEETIVKLQMQISTLESQYNKRASRPEDLEKIEQLKAVILEKQAEVEKVHAEMKFFKLELVNREENFNSVFGNQPRVGVMDNSAVSTSSKKAHPVKGRADTKFPTLGPTSTSAPSGPNVGRPRGNLRRGSVGGA